MIHATAGDKLREECAKFPADRNGIRCYPGDAKITDGFKLPCKKVIHTVGPNLQNTDRRTERAYKKALADAESDLAHCYLNSLALLIEDHLNDGGNENKTLSIAFPSISSGIFRYRNTEASKVAINTIKDCLKAVSEHYPNLSIDVIICGFHDNTYKPGNLDDKVCYLKAMGENPL